MTAIAVGDVVRVLNRTYGLAPSRPADAPSPVVEVVRLYTGLVRTASGRLADAGGYEVVSRAKSVATGEPIEFEERMTMTNQPALFSMFEDGDHARTRRTDPVTSHEAADANQGSVAESRDFVLYLMGETGPVADHELVEAAEKLFRKFPETKQWSPSRIRTARHELAEVGRIVDASYFHMTPRGRRATVWEVAS